MYWFLVILFGCVLRPSSAVGQLLRRNMRRELIAEAELMGKLREPW